MEVDTSCKDVRAGETLEGQLRTVGSATDGLYLGSHTAILHRVQYNIYHVHLRINLFLHVIVLILHLCSYCTFTVLLIHLHDAFLNQSLAVFKLAAVMVTYDIA